MKAYNVTKVIYANSLLEAISKESEGVVLGGGIADEFGFEDYKVVQDRRKQAKEMYDRG